MPQYTKPESHALSRIRTHDPGVFAGKTFYVLDQAATVVSFSSLITKKNSTGIFFLIYSHSLLMKTNVFGKY